MDAQRAAVESYSGQSGAEIVREFTEVESGGKTDHDRPKLADALLFTKRAGATLVVAKLDRLARNVAFLARLMEAGVEFVCCDNPHANRFTVHILAAVAEWGREQISNRGVENANITAPYFCNNESHCTFICLHLQVTGTESRS